MGDLKWFGFVNPKKIFIRDFEIMLNDDILKDLDSLDDEEDQMEDMI